MATYEAKQCAYCGRKFEPTTGNAKYCPEHSRGSWERNNPDRAAEDHRLAQARHRQGSRVDRALGSRGTKLVDGKRIPIADLDPAVLTELAEIRAAKQRESKRAYKARQREARDKDA